jgi:predicted nucleic acid-binding protein
MIVIDTSILIDALHRKNSALRTIRELQAAGEVLCTTQINVLELYKEIYHPAKSKSGLEKVRKLLDALIILPIDDDVYDVFGKLSAELEDMGGTIGDFDELIASIALINGAAIVTGDRHFQRIPGLEVVSP